MIGELTLYSHLLIHKIPDLNGPHAISILTALLLGHEIEADYLATQQTYGTVQQLLLTSSALSQVVTLDQGLVVLWQIYQFEREVSCQ